MHAPTNPPRLEANLKEIESVQSKKRFYANEIKPKLISSIAKEILENQVNLTSDNYKNVFRLAKILTRSASAIGFEENRNLVETIKAISTAIFKAKVELNSHRRSRTSRSQAPPRKENLFHLLAAKGAFRIVQALTDLDPNLACDLKDHREMTALAYAKESQAQYANREEGPREGHRKIIKLFTVLNSFLSQKIVAGKTIRCTKGKDPSVSELIDHIDKMGLKIINSYQYQNVSYHCTNVFTYAVRPFSGRSLIFAFVEHSGTLYPRLFWLSKSQAIWRRFDKRFKNWIGKTSKGEGRLAVPIAVNMLFFKIFNENLIKELPSNKDPEPFFKQVISWSAKSKSKKRSDKEQDASDLDKTDIEANSASATKDNLEVIGPRKLPSNPSKNNMVNIDLDPDFTTCQSLHLIESPFYGKLVARTFLSFDKTIRYLFLENTNRQVFLAGAEFVRENVNTRGINENWVDLGSLSLPLKEYRGQFHASFLNESDKAKIERKIKVGYVSTWNYLLQMPFIQDYYRSPRGS
ncbi:hypothetical protein PHSC3_000817 [Chlamydiales bacterium STE3]|nr:hypothetical protein PHSC3_000817 [Chlamydiales bacterium STE3]